MRRHVLANSVTWPFQGPVIIYVEAGGGGGSKLFQIGQRGWAKRFYKGVQWGQQFDREVYFKRGPLAKMGKAVKQQSTKDI